MKKLFLLTAFLFLVAWVLPAAEGRSVKVILWFDTEDYILPADDDACKRLAQMLSDRGIRATFKVVGEKARVLEGRGRRDVISALKKHDIAYHANFHSVHPTPTEYLADCGWLDGIEEFVSREGPGAGEVKRIFSVRMLGCYGQPGSSWAPQAIAALKRIGVAPHGVPCYVDEGDHVGLDEKPFWYAGALNVYHMGQNCTRMELHDPEALEPAEHKVAGIADRLRGQGGGLISIYYHPCEWVHRQFWDGVNFSRGANPPREKWQKPPQRTQVETDAAFERFGQYIDFIRRLPGVGFVCASDLPGLYPDAVRQAGAGEDVLNEIASRILAEQGNLNFFSIGSAAYSVADQFELLVTAVSAITGNGKPRFPLVAKGLFGPDAPPATCAIAKVDWPAFRDSQGAVVSFIRDEQRVPARIFIGADSVPPGSYLAALASVWDFHRKTGRLPLNEGVELGLTTTLLPERHVAEDRPGLFGGWIIHKENFRAPKVLEQARLQAWTLKPALPGM